MININSKLKNQRIGDKEFLKHSSIIPSFIGKMLLLVLALMNLACNRQTQNKIIPPNIIFILVDDQRNDMFGYAGHPVLQTPIVDSLAQNGVRFTNSFVTTSICAASRASILTGLYESKHGYTFGTDPISENYIEKSYPKILKDAGYRTGFIGKFGVKLEKQDS